MGLFGPAKNTQRASPSKVKTGGAGNMQWYNDDVAAAAAARPFSARSTRSSAGMRAQAQEQPTQLLSPASYRPLYSTRPASASVYPASMRADNGASAPPAEAAHEESCICTICTCGKHACPPTPRESHYDPNLASESRRAYTGEFSPAKRVGAPDAAYKPRNIPFEGESTAHADYRNFGVVPRTSAQSTRGALMDTGVGRNHTPFDDTTTHKSDFPAHPIRPRSAVGAKDNNLTTSGPDDRDFTSESRNQYRPHPLQPRSRGGPGYGSLPVSLPFCGTSTQKSDYRAHHGARPSVPKFSSHAYAPSPEDREFATENRTHFVPKTREDCPAIPVATSVKFTHGHIPVERVTGTTTYRRKQMMAATQGF